MDIRHEPDSHHFVAQLEDGRALLRYRLRDDSVWDLKHTYVPRQRRGEGIATRLVRHALEAARGEDRRIIPTCPFVEDFLDENPEYRELVADEAK